ncbi:hypothetical protein F2Q70_00044973 [Brassica cretica]|uniref:Uncharacterized protein n=1 Tax=Brassica cretica TaxID=69181 RepID=A0A8S9KHW4_BRACR|nr:hypothetical protein F2Q70_00044973 [Brassica cretica]
MSILSWNCQGAGSVETVRHLRGLHRNDCGTGWPKWWSCGYVEGQFSGGGFVE